MTPNQPYVVLESNRPKTNTTTTDGEVNLFLSSDGSGKMQLKEWNNPIPGPPRTTPEVDPALLFRVVRPLGQN
jgi:hypothetical protein